MIYTDMTKKAMRKCFEVHKDQKDKSGIPYVFHPFHLAEQMQDETSTVAALLHDVVEDSDTSIEDLQREGFSEAVIDALKLLTHDKNIPYMDYIEKIKVNPVARAVKIADLKHNSDLTRLETITDDDLRRVEKYNNALGTLLVIGASSELY